MTDASAVDDRPTLLASQLAVLAAGGSLLVVLEASAQRRAIVPVVLGLLALLAGSRRASEDRSVGVVVAVAGAIAMGLGFEVTLSAPLSSLETAELGPGLLGVAVLGLALVPVRRGWTVTLATAGAGLVLQSVLFSGISHSAGGLTLLAGTAGTVVAWDAARHAITLGRQVGRRADTTAVELRHVGATVAVGGLLVGGAEAVWRLGVGGYSLSAFVVFLGAAVALLVGLYGRSVPLAGSEE